MANVLATIVADKEVEIAQRKQDFPVQEFATQLAPSSKSFYQALKQGPASYIFECKKASPSKGLIREHFDLDEIIDSYGQYASCISVLTDEKYFQGKFEYLEYVSARVTQPVLNKDFFVDEYQIHLARYYKADAVLLMLSVLDDDRYIALKNLAQSYKMDVLTEVSNLEETQRALALGANIIGINNRDLRDLSTNLATTEQLVPIIKASGFDGVIISESGIYTHQDVLRLSPLVNGFLVGSALMAQADLRRAVESLIYGEVKVCGISSAEQAMLLSQYPVSYLGLINVPDSKRYVTLETMKNIAQISNKPLVGVFQNHPLDTVVECACETPLYAVQLHGEESDEYIQQLREALPSNVQIWQTRAVDTHANEASTAQSMLADRLLLDTKVGAQSGGTGKSFNWQILQSDQWRDKLSQVILAGGITPHNALDAQRTGVQTIDVNSGVEIAPGNKSADLLTELFTQIRNY